VRHDPDFFLESWQMVNGPFSFRASTLSKTKAVTEWDSGACKEFHSFTSSHFIIAGLFRAQGTV
jgi:hypothetical protein